MNARRIVSLVVALLLMGCVAVDRWADQLPGKEGGRADWDKSGNNAANSGDSQRNPAAIPIVAPTAAPTPPSSRYLQYAEQFAKGAGCERPAATMNYRTASSETFTVACSNGDARSIRCDNGDCRELK
jgi:hypothetical protein